MIKKMEEVSPKMVLALKEVVEGRKYVIGPVEKAQAHAIRQGFYRWRMRVNAERASPGFFDRFAAMLKVEEGIMPYLNMVNEIAVAIEEKPNGWYVKFYELWGTSSWGRVMEK